MVWVNVQKFLWKIHPSCLTRHWACNCSFRCFRHFVCRTKPKADWARKEKKLSPRAHRNCNETSEKSLLLVLIPNFYWFQPDDTPSSKNRKMSLSAQVIGTWSPSNGPPFQCVIVWISPFVVYFLTRGLLLAILDVIPHVTQKTEVYFILGIDFIY